MPKASLDAEMVVIKPPPGYTFAIEHWNATEVEADMPLGYYAEPGCATACLRHETSSSASRTMFLKYVMHGRNNSLVIFLKEMYQDFRSWPTSLD